MGKVQCDKTKKERKLSMQGVKALRGGNPHRGDFDSPLCGLKNPIYFLTNHKYGRV